MAGTIRSTMVLGNVTFASSQASSGSGFGRRQGGGEGADQLAGQLAVAGKVVARDDGEGPGSGPGTLLEPAGDLSDGRLRRLPGEVGLDLFVGGVEGSGAADRSGSPSP